MDKENLIQLTNKLYRITLLFPKKEPLRYKIREIADEILENFVVWEVFHNQALKALSARQASNPTKSKSVDKQELIFDIEKNLEILNNYLEITKWQNWVSYFDILEIEEEYDKIKGKIQEKADSFETQKAITPIKKEETTGLPARNASHSDAGGLIEKIHPVRGYQDNEKAQSPQFFNGVNKQIEVERNKNENIENFDIKTAKPCTIEPFDKIDKPDALNSRKEKILKILREKEKVQVGEISAVFSEVSKRTIRRDFVQLLKQGLIERIGEKNDTFYQLKKQNI